MGENKNTLLLSVLSALVMGALILVVYHFSIPNPNMILIVALVLFTGIGGWIPGAVSAVLILLYSMFFFSTGHSFFEYTDQNMQKILIILIGDLSCYLMVGLLKHSRDKEHAQLAESNRHLTELVNAKRETQEIRQEYEKSRHESLVYSHIASSLSADYSYVYCVNVETDEYVEYQAESRGGDLSVVTRAGDFFEESHRNALTMIYEADRADFLAQFTKRNIVETLDKQDLFTLVYRLVVDGKPQYMSMKANRMKGDAENIVIGVMNIDEQMKAQQTVTLVDQERAVYARMNALSGDFIAMYSVNPETCHYREYSASTQYDELNIVCEGDDFFATARENALRVVYADDQEKFISLFDRANVMEEINANGIFTLKYRLMLEGSPVYVRLKAALVTEKEGMRLIVGVINISEQVKQDEVYERHLSLVKSLANRDELTGVKNKHAYAEAERDLNDKIESRDSVEFAVVVCDVNELKSVNDTQGHAAGDEYLKQACMVICKVFAHSPVFRVGGDEFAVISQGSDYENIDALVAQLDDRNADNLSKGEAVIACGMARYGGEQNVAAVFDKADKLMYENKRKMKMVPAPAGERTGSAIALKEAAHGCL